MLEAGNRGLAVLPAQHAAIRRLAPAAGIEGRPSKNHLARPRFQHRGLERQRFGVVVAEIMRHRVTGGCRLAITRYLCRLRCSRIGDNCGALSCRRSGELARRQRVGALEMPSERALIVEPDSGCHIRDGQSLSRPPHPSGRGGRGHHARGVAAGRVTTDQA